MVATRCKRNGKSSVVLQFAFQTCHPGLRNVAPIWIHIPTWCTFSHPTFPNGVYEMQTKWEVNRGATFRFPDTSSRFAECCTNLDPHSDMVHFFSSYICKWWLLHVQSEYLAKCSALLYSIRRNNTNLKILVLIPNYF